MSHGELEYVEKIEGLPIMCRVVCLESSSPHWHHEYEALLALRGGVSVKCAESLHSLEAGDIMLVNSREIHSISAPREGCLCMVLQFSPALLSDIYTKVFRFFLNTREETMTNETVAIFRRDLSQIALLLIEKPDGYQFLVKGHLFNFIGSMFRFLKYSINDGDEKDSIDLTLDEFDTVRKYIMANFMKEISIDQLCRDTAMSRAKLYRVLKSAGADSCKALVDYYRVEAAKSLLLNADVPVQLIAQSCGFESDSAFHRVFKKLAGATPSAFRKEPQSRDMPIGIQGYADYSEPEAVSLLRKYSC
jgi:AraC-like DNA-binding protein